MFRKAGLPLPAFFYAKIISCYLIIVIIFRKREKGLGLK
ncbi:hypothetical protein S100072_02783 [Bacillus velezensis]|nr:hypothetical protein S100072_02783 [Bacillus velezensis]ASB66493.1 hypothetical protein S101413_03051 [Bacillus velezensis]